MLVTIHTAIKLQAQKYAN